MRIVFFSDLHLTHWERVIGTDRVNENLERLVEECADANPDIILNLGDTVEAPEWHDNPDLMRELFEGLPYFEIMGNHDFYHGVFGSTCKIETVGQDKIFLGTLWTNFRGNPLAEMVAARSINDFRLIKECNPTACKDAYLQATEMIQTEKPNIVCTHFPPIKACINEVIHPTDMLTNYFVNDMEDVFRSNPQIDIWLAGHTHADFDVTHRGIRVVSNMLGYPTENFNEFEDYHARVVYT